ncbi:MAG: META domain-containing protein [Planctomycetes bacterium]|nr:META domain-containing protein [Planctomycetota bacterium]
MNPAPSLTLATLAACLASCASSPDMHANPDRPAKPDQPELQPTARATMNDLAGNWTLATIHSAPAPAFPGDPDPVGFSIAPDGALSGYTGVNRMSGRLDPAAVPSGGFRVGPIATTRRAGPPERMKLEADFTAALDLAARFTLSGDTLSLFKESPDGAPLLVLTRPR